MTKMILNLNFYYASVCVTFLLISSNLYAAQKNEVVKTLDMIIGDDYLPSEKRFSYQFLCAGDNYSVALVGRNYQAADGKSFTEITQIQSNASQVKSADLNAINKYIHGIGGFKIFSSQLKCNKHQVKFEFAVRREIDGKFSDGIVAVTLSNNAIIKLDDYNFRRTGSSKH